MTIRPPLGLSILILTVILSACSKEGASTLSETTEPQTDFGPSSNRPSTATPSRDEEAGTVTSEGSKNPSSDPIGSENSGLESSIPDSQVSTPGVLPSNPSVAQTTSGAFNGESSTSSQTLPPAPAPTTPTNEATISPSTDPLAGTLISASASNPKALEPQSPLETASFSPSTSSEESTSVTTSKEVDPLKGTLIAANESDTVNQTPSLPKSSLTSESPTTSPTEAIASTAPSIAEENEAMTSPSSSESKIVREKNADSETVAQALTNPQATSSQTGVSATSNHSADVNRPSTGVASIPESSTAPQSDLKDSPQNLISHESTSQNSPDPLAGTFIAASGSKSEASADSMNAGSTVAVPQASSNTGTIIGNSTSSSPSSSPEAEIGAHSNGSLAVNQAPTSVPSIPESSSKNSTDPLAGTLIAARSLDSAPNHVETTEKTPNVTTATSSITPETSVTETMTAKGPSVDVGGGSSNGPKASESLPSSSYVAESRDLKQAPSNPGTTSSESGVSPHSNGSATVNQAPTTVASVPDSSAAPQFDLRDGTQSPTTSGSLSPTSTDPLAGTLIAASGSGSQSTAIQSPFENPAFYSKPTNVESTPKAETAVLTQTPTSVASPVAAIEATTPNSSSTIDSPQQKVTGSGSATESQTVANGPSPATSDLLAKTPTNDANRGSESSNHAVDRAPASEDKNVALEDPGPTIAYPDPISPEIPVTKENTLVAPIIPPPKSNLTWVHPSMIELPPHSETVCSNLSNATKTLTPGRGLLARIFDGSKIRRVVHTSQIIRRGNLLDTALIIPDLNFSRLVHPGYLRTDGAPILNSKGLPLRDKFSLHIKTHLELAPEDEEGLYQLSVIADDGIRIFSGRRRIVSVDRVTSTIFECSARPFIRMERGKPIPLTIRTLSGPAGQSAVILLWRKVRHLNRKTLTGKRNNDDIELRCKEEGNHFFHDPTTNLAPTSDFLELLDPKKRKIPWKIIRHENFKLPENAGKGCGI